MRLGKKTETKTKTTTKTVLVVSSHRHTFFSIASMVLMMGFIPGMWYDNPVYYGLSLLGMGLGYITTERMITEPHSSKESAKNV